MLGRRQHLPMESVEAAVAGNGGWIKAPATEACGETQGGKGGGVPRASADTPSCFFVAARMNFEVPEWVTEARQERAPRAQKQNRKPPPHPPQPMYCAKCEMWLNGQSQWDHHISLPKHNGGNKVAKVVIPSSTAYIIEQSASYDDATKQYMLSLYKRCALPSRL